MALNDSYRTRSPSRAHETGNVESVLQHHRQIHDELTTDLGRMARQLKMNSQSFGDTLGKDDKVMTIIGYEWQCQSQKGDIKRRGWGVNDKQKY